MLPTTPLHPSQSTSPSAGVGWRACGRALLLFILLITIGCTVKPSPRSLRWDLRRSHTKQDVHWRSETDVWSIDHINVTILLPGERTFAAPGVNAILAACRDQDQVWQVALYLYPARTIDEAYRQATQLAQEWHLDTADLESWYHGVLAGKRQGIKDSNEAFSTGGMGGEASRVAVRSPLRRLSHPTMSSGPRCCCSTSRGTIPPVPVRLWTSPEERGGRWHALSSTFAANGRRVDRSRRSPRRLAALLGSRVAPNGGRTVGP
jgi:hypothetical protein